YEVAVNIKRTDTLKYKPGNIIIFNIENYIIGWPVVKLLLKFESPFRIIRIDLYLLELSLPTNIKVTYIINVSRVKPYVEGLPG
ncbi:hypothetical protein GE21DRAFT_1221615, partial [Neurospora crassa]